MAKKCMVDDIILIMQGGKNMELKTVWEKYNENDLKELDVFTED